MRLRLTLEDTSDGYAVLSEVEIQQRLHPRDYERRRLQIAKYILATGCTLREAAEVFGIHNSNVYRAVAPILGHPYSDLPEVWRENKRVAPERARATVARRARWQAHAGVGRKGEGESGESSA